MDALRVSIIIPVFNGGLELRQCLDAVAASSYPVFECILVDDASTDGMTRKTAKQYGARLIELTEQQGPGLARNRGVEEATGDIIFFVDADVLVAPDTLAIGVKVLQSEPDIAAVFGSYDDEPGHHSFLSQYRNLFHHWVHQTARKEASTFWTGCGLIRRTVFLEMGGFSASYHRPSIEDIELGSRMCRSGHKIRMEKTMLCKHLKQWRFWNLVATDIFRRGAPWMVLLLRNRNAPSDLNLSHGSRLATFLAGILALSLAILPMIGHAEATIPALAFLLAAIVSMPVAVKRGTGKLPARMLTWILFVAAPVAAYLLLPDPLAFIPLTLILLLISTHLPFYRYVARKRSSVFAFAVIPMQVVFFLSCAVSGVLGLIIYFFGAGREPAAH